MVHIMRDLVQTIGNLIEKCSVATLCYIDEMGYPVARAMLAPREREEIRVLWFSTNTSSDKVHCFKRDPKGSYS